MRFALLSVVAVFCAAPAFGDEGSRRPAIGDNVGDFSAHDYLGKDHSWQSLSQGRPLVAAFLGTECPLAKLYAPRLAELAAEFGPRGVAFVGIDSNRQDSVTEIASFARVHGLTFPVLKDLKQKLADQMGATRTPEVLLLDSEGTIRYRGRIDDQFGFIADASNANYQRPAAVRRDLAEAVKQLLASKPIEVAETETPGCLIGRDREPVADSDVTYSKQIVRIFNDRCVFCHREGQIAPFTLTEYDEVAGWADMIREVVDIGRMPPWHADPKYGHFKNSARLSDEEKELIRRWVKNGAPEGDPADLPEPPSFVEGWMIPEPDEVIYMADEPYTVPAQGVVEYQHFVVDPGWTEEKWIAAIEPKPGNPAVVHHILIFVQPPGGRSNSIGGEDDFLGAFAPGLRPEPLGKGLARRVPAGSKLIFQMHYTPIGTEQQDRSSVGVVFAKPGDVEKEVVVSSAINAAFEIPPGEDNHEVNARYVFRRDSLLLTLMPHMHLRGKDFSYEAVYPDGSRETLLSVPQYDFGWQTNYRLTEPKLMPQGTVLQCVAHFDNSEENLNNPDPSNSVRFGDQTFEEMMIGFFEAMPVEQNLAAGKNPPQISRTEESLVILRATGGEPDDNLKLATYLALTDEEWFGRLGVILPMMTPQVDRVCITTVEDGKLKQLHGPFRPRARDGGPTPPPGLRANVSGSQADEDALAGYLASGEPVINGDLSNIAGAAVEQLRAAGARSSLHVPVEMSGRRATVNFWSREPNAFPEPVAKLLAGIARAMTAPKDSGPQASR